MAFKNPILAGIQLIRTAIRSPNYVAGTSGWTINQDGTAEFTGLTVTGGTIVESGASGGIFVYSGVPGVATLILSIAPAAGVNPYGTAYPKGLGVFWNKAGVATLAGKWDLTDDSLQVINPYAAQALRMLPGGASTVPTIYLDNGTTGTASGWVNGPAANVAEISSGITGGGGNQRSRIWLEPTQIIAQVMNQLTGLPWGGWLNATQTILDLAVSDAAGVTQTVLELTTSSAKYNGVPIAVGGSTVVTTNGAGQATINTGLSRVDSFTGGNGDGNAYSCFFLNKLSTLGGAVTFNLKNTAGALIAGTTVRVDWQATGW